MWPFSNAELQTLIFLYEKNYIQNGKNPPTPFLFICLFLSVSVYSSFCTYICMNACVCVYVYVCIYICMCIYILYTYIYSPLLSPLLCAEHIRLWDCVAFMCFYHNYAALTFTHEYVAVWVAGWTVKEHCCCRTGMWETEQHNDLKTLCSLKCLSVVVTLEQDLKKYYHYAFLSTIAFLLSLKKL